MVNKNNNNLLIENKKPFEVVVELPSVEEIQKHGISAELREQLLNPNAKFRKDLVVFPVWNEEWEDLKVSCMASGCWKTSVSYWKHANCSYIYPSNIKWSTHARLFCPSCGTVSDISRWSFKCHGGGHSYQTTDLVTLTDVVSALLEYEGANRQFASRFLKSAKEIFNDRQ